MSSTTFFGIIVTALSIWMIVRSIRTKRALEKYEFDNRTDGGVVKFETFEESKRHERRQAHSNGWQQLGCLGLLVGIVMVMLGFSSKSLL